VRRVFAIAWKDLRDIYRTPSSLVLMLVAPLAVASILGLAFGGQDGNFQLQAVKTAVVNLDASARQGSSASGPASASEPAAVSLVKILRGRDLHDLVDVTMYKTADAAREAVDNGDAAAAVLIPEGFSAAVTSMSGKKAAVEVYEDPTLEVGPAIIEGLVEQVLGEFNGARAAAASAAALGAKAAMASGGVDVSRITATAQRAAERYAAGARESGVRVAGRAPEVSKADGGKPNEVGVTAMVLAGQLVFFILFGASVAARTILVEQQQGTLARLFTTPTPHLQILGGKYVLAFLTVLVQSIIILLAGWLLFRIDWGSAPTTVVLCLAGCLVASSLAMLIGSLTHTLAQEGAIGSGIYLVLALLGGNFTGSVDTGGVADVLRMFTPNGWLLLGWDAAMRGGTLGDIALGVAVVLAFTIVFFVASVVILRRRFA